jgi:hypothetical protein
MPKGKTQKTNKKNVIYLFLLIFLGGFIGSVLGEIIGFYTSEESSLHFFLTKGLIVGFTSPFTLDLRVLNLTFGLNVKFNFLSILGFLLGFLLYKMTM